MKKVALIFLNCLFLILFLGCNSHINNLTTETNADQTPVAKETGSETDARDETGKKVTLTLYFANEDNSAILKEKREITVYEGAIMRSAVEALMEGPTEQGMGKTIPDGTKLLGIKRDKDTAVVDFSKEYNSSNDIAGTAERISVVNTLTEITGIEKVRILVEGKILLDSEGEPFGDMKRVALDESGRAIPGEVKSITLYFGAPNADTVVAEKRDVVASKEQMLEEIIFEELCKGPETKGLYPTIPKGTELLSVETGKDGVCRLDLSKEFIDNSSGGSASESITLNSIVNSLTELSNVKRVQFLIEGKTREVYTHEQFDKPFERNESSIKR